MVKEQNMLDVYVLIEGFSLLLIERVFLFEQDKLVFFSFFFSISTTNLINSKKGGYLT